MIPLRFENSEIFRLCIMSDTKEGVLDVVEHDVARNNAAAIQSTLKAIVGAGLSAPIAQIGRGGGSFLLSLPPFYS